MSSKYMRVGIVLVLAALLASLVVYVVAQPPGRFQGPNQPGQGMRGMMVGGPRGMGGAIAVSGNAVFVVAGGMLLKYDAETLELLAQAELPQPEIQWPQPPPPPGQ